MKRPHQSPPGARLHRRARLISCAVAALLWQATAASLPAQSPIAASQVEPDVTFLADDSMQGRGIGTEGIDRAAEFIAKRFADLGLKTDLVDGGPYQTFMSSTRVPRVKQGVDWDAVQAAKAKADGVPQGADTGKTAPMSDDSSDETPARPKRSQRRPAEAKNVLGLLVGEGPLADELVVVGAHYDHLGYRQKRGETTVFNGANDNASGTAGLLEIARILSQREQKLPRSVLFIAFSAEERGLVGSFFYIKHPVLPLKKTVAMVNLDMIGCMEESRVMASGSGTSKLLTQKVIRAARRHDLNLIEMPGPVGGSDHMAFYTHEIPVVHFITTGGWKDYHEPTDDVETLDFEGLEQISQMAADLVVELAESSERPQFEDRGWGGTIVRNLFRFMGAAASKMAEPEE